MIVAVLRHAEAVSSDRVYLPDQDRVITDWGARCAAGLVPVLTAYAPDMCWLSGSRRAEQTWELASVGLSRPARTHRGLAERIFPSWEGLTVPEIVSSIGPEQVALARICTDLVTVPGAESLAEVET